MLTGKRMKSCRITLQIAGKVAAGEVLHNQLPIRHISIYLMKKRDLDCFTCSEPTAIRPITCSSSAFLSRRPEKRSSTRCHLLSPMNSPAMVDNAVALTVVLKIGCGGGIRSEVWKRRLGFGGFSFARVRFPEGLPGHINRPMGFTEMSKGSLKRARGFEYEYVAEQRRYHVSNHRCLSVIDKLVYYSNSDMSSSSSSSLKSRLPVIPDEDSVYCKCGFTVRRWVSRTPKNPGRRFDKCPYWKIKNICNLNTYIENNQTLGSTDYCKP
ncbi:hypothetical protein LXL04_003937 [Taraxacum kok-saghyz]